MNKVAFANEKIHTTLQRLASDSKSVQQRRMQAALKKMY